MTIDAKIMAFCLQTGLLRRNHAQQGEPDTPVPLLCRVSCQQFCLQAKSHIFFASIFLVSYYINCKNYFLRFFDPKPSTLPQGGPARGRLGPPSVERSDLGQHLWVLGRRNTRNN